MPSSTVPAATIAAMACQVTCFLPHQPGRQQYPSWSAGGEETYSHSNEAAEEHRVRPPPTNMQPSLGVQEAILVVDHPFLGGIEPRLRNQVPVSLPTVD